MYFSFIFFYFFSSYFFLSFFLLCVCVCVCVFILCCNICLEELLISSYSSSSSFFFFFFFACGGGGVSFQFLILEDCMNIFPQSVFLFCFFVCFSFSGFNISWKSCEYLPTVFHTELLP